ncbi:type II toxin-antitoxin system Phd/YefM family antitoxin [Streptomyces sp. NPDC059740]|uniref:type II toxin-antitoxin system Phd/YefM family antitoxin n=1 Tax=Streptomyces sp. NPDC059740 TaxID=3346926 RepID=UPI003669FEBD
MENDLGIEAARAKLGEITDHVRTTGQTVRLTRHGRPVAAIGPVNAIQPAGAVEATLYFPHTERTVTLPAVPRIGETLHQTLEHDETSWRVTEVEWNLSWDEAPPTLGIILDPADEHTERLMPRLTAEHQKAARSRHTTTEK